MLQSLKGFRDFLPFGSVFDFSQGSCYREVSEGGHLVTLSPRWSKAQSLSLRLTQYNQFVKVNWLSASNMTKYFGIPRQHTVKNLSMILRCPSMYWFALLVTHSMLSILLQQCTLRASVFFRSYARIVWDSVPYEKMRKSMSKLVFIFRNSIEDFSMMPDAR